MKKWIRFGSVGLAVALIATLVLVSLPTTVNISQSGFLSVSTNVALAVNNPPDSGPVTLRSIGVSPTGYIANGWTGPTLAYDGDIGTKASYDVPKKSVWSPYLELTIHSTPCRGVNVWSSRESAYISDMEVDVYYSGAWHNIHTGSINVDNYVSYMIGSEQSVTAMRVRYYNSSNGLDQFAYVNEAAFISGGSIALRSVGVSPGSGSSSCIIVKPAGLTVGDLMIAHVVNATVTSGTPDPTSAPGGWTEIRQDARASVRSALFWKIADSGDVAASDFTFTVDNSDLSPSNIGAISAWIGHDATTPINASNGQGNDSTTVTSPAITPSVADCMILMIAGTRDNVTVSNYRIADDNPASWTEAYDINTTAGTDSTAAMGYALRPETSATGNGQADLPSQERNLGHLVAIAPAAAEPDISNTPSEKAFGILEVNTYSSTAINYFTIENTGGGAVDITVHATDLAGGNDTWDLSDTATPGENIYGLYAGLDDDDDNFDVIVKESEAYNELVNNLLESATQDWGLRLYMPTSVTDYDGQQMSATLTLICSAH